jgi:hypothetical protein
MYRVLVYDADGFGWLVAHSHHNREQARATAFLLKQERAYQWVAFVQVRIQVSDGATVIEMLDCNAPTPNTFPRWKRSARPQQPSENRASGARRLLVGRVAGGCGRHGVPRPVSPVSTTKLKGAREHDLPRRTQR